MYVPPDPNVPCQHCSQPMTFNDCYDRGDQSGGAEDWVTEYWCIQCQRPLILPSREEISTALIGPGLGQEA